MTKEEIQIKIDHYNAVAQGYFRLGKMELYNFYLGKADAYMNIYHSLYPEMNKERAFPFDMEKFEKTIKETIEMENLIKNGNRADRYRLSR